MERVEGYILTQFPDPIGRLGLPGREELNPVVIGISVIVFCLACFVLLGIKISSRAKKRAMLQVSQERMLIQQKRRREFYQNTQGRVFMVGIPRRHVLYGNVHVDVSYIAANVSPLALPAGGTKIHVGFKYAGDAVDLTGISVYIRLRNGSEQVQRIRGRGNTVRFPITPNEIESVRFEADVHEPISQENPAREEK